MKVSFPKNIFIEKDVVDSPVTRQIIRSLPNIPVEYVEDYRKIKIKGSTLNGIYRESKECLAIARKKGKLVKQFRCRDGIIGSTEYYIAHGNNCYFDCEYCFLQGYFDNAIPVLFVNHKEMLSEIRDVIIAAGDKRIVFHAGELCDSLVFDDLTDLSHRLIHLFAEFPNATLELRTKAVQIERLLSVSGIDNVVISWTFSPQEIIDVYEHKTPSLEDRIRAAGEAQEAGYNVGICLDPIIRCEDWFNNYNAMLKILFDRLDITKIKFVSLGGFRFLPSLASVIRERNPQTDLFLGEFVPCIDGKYRYFRPVRSEIYREIANIIRRRGNGIKTFLCMETREVWNEVADVLNETHT
jgi:spore photoproduct lyase